VDLPFGGGKSPKGEMVPTIIAFADVQEFWKMQEISTRVHEPPKIKGR
jgi:hypothetical protein